jgi:hypothetical protein
MRNLLNAGQSAAATALGLTPVGSEIRRQHPFSLLSALLSKFAPIHAATMEPITDAELASL